jgi:hypothetical protein
VFNSPPGGGYSAPALFTVTVPAAKMTITASTPVVTWGQPVTLAVQFAAAGAGRSVSIQRMQANETDWSTIATLTADPSGLATFTYTPPVNTQFQAVFAGAPDLGSAASQPVRVVVRQTLVLRPTTLGKVKQVGAGTAVTFTATIRPVGPALARAKVTFGFWHLVNGTWQFVTRREVYVDASGRASWTWTFGVRGQWYVRALANPTLTGANSAWSPLERYLVS